MAKRVSAWLADHEPDGDPAFPLRGYAALYGPESYSAAHGGLGAIKQYFEPRADQAERIVAGPWLHSGNDHRLALSTAMVRALANQVAGRLDLPREALAEFSASWAIALGVNDQDREP